MSFLKRLFGGKDETCAAKPVIAGNQICLVDASSILEARQRNNIGQGSPRDHFAVLRALAQFANREDMELIAVFNGRPLREAGEGGLYKRVRVFYAENNQAVRARIKELIEKYGARKQVVVVSAEAGIESEARQMGATCMRASTLKKNIEEYDEREHSDRNNRERGGNRAANANRDNANAGNNAPTPPAQKSNNAEPSAGAPPRAPQKPPADKPNAEVLNLIDPM